MTASVKSDSISIEIENSQVKYFHIFVRGFEGRTTLLGYDYKFNAQSKIKELRDAISNVTGIN